MASSNRPRARSRDRKKVTFQIDSKKNEPDGNYVTEVKKAEVVPLQPCPCKTQVDVTFAAPVPEPAPVQYALNFLQLDSVLDVWSTILNDEEWIFRRQFEETQYMANLIELSKSLLDNLQQSFDEINQMQNRLEANAVILECNLSELETAVDNLEKCTKNGCPNLNENYVYNALMNIDCDVRCMESKLSEVKCYFSRLEGDCWNNPLRMVHKVINLNTNTLGTLMNGVGDIDRLASVVNQQMISFEAIHTLKAASAVGCT